MLLLAAFVAAAQLERVTHVDASTPESIQIALAESAAPSAISADAAVFVIGPSGYRKVRDSRNGFTCLISRQYRNTLEPECFDAEGTATVLPTRIFVESRRAEGTTDEAIVRELEDGYSSGRFVAPRKPGIVYMLSPHNRVMDPERKEIIAFPGVQRDEEIVDSGRGAYRTGNRAIRANEDPGGTDGGYLLAQDVLGFRLRRFEVWRQC